jgi:hypothetical protein
VEEVVKLIREFGFPTLFCLWLMWRDNKKTDLHANTLSRVLVLLTVLTKLQGIEVADDPPEEKKP